MPPGLTLNLGQHLVKWSSRLSRSGLCQRKIKEIFEILSNRLIVNQPFQKSLT